MEKSAMRKHHRRGQIEFGESLMVVIILVFILVIGIVFYYKVGRASLSEEFAYRDDIESLKLADAVLSMPEVRCGSYTSSQTCIDQLKIEKLALILKKSEGDFDQSSREYYEKLFGYATIKLNIVKSATDISEILLYEDKPATIAAYSSSPQYIFTTLYDPVTKKVQFGYLNVTRYSKEVTA